MPRFDCAVWRPISCNHGGALSANKGLILHHAIANGSLYSFFNSPAAEVSTQFWVSKGGTIEQYLDSGTKCWGGMDLNPYYCMVETEGCVSDPYAEPMTEAMIDALARLYAEGARRHGWPNRKANSNGESGFGYHRMPGSGAATGCPCDTRLNMRDEILRRAFGGEPSSPPQAEPEGEDDEPMICSFTNPSNGNQEVWEVNSKGDLYHRYWNKQSAKWAAAAKKGSGYTGSPSFATNDLGTLHVYVQKAGDKGVDHYYYSGGGWVRAAI